ncbi:MAG: response regulator, partial [Planctomycetota bacterium]
MARILIVDDEERIRDSLEMILGYEKHETAQASRGESALELLRSQPFDLVLLDVKLPGKDGLEVLHEIQGLESPPPVSFTSSSTKSNGCERSSSSADSPR